MTDQHKARALARRFLALWERQQRRAAADGAVAVESRADDSK